MPAIELLALESSIGDATYRVRMTDTWHVAVVVFIGAGNCVNHEQIFFWSREI